MFFLINIFNIILIYFYIKYITYLDDKIVNFYKFQEFNL